ncbi:DEAD-box ATP-dependent RNA helicase 28 [Phalaenopsis equestris]|uniref:DEAD-box ATP-dependent RNA helicase 28 n=1 Tax=Phalaenopsis equestris TaxID=78828 RepID=UPI0009E2CF1D|nr:DEAD-box ATP-dependent RNA helicase 28 [Phalaenopsis equestris]
MDPGFCFDGGSSDEEPDREEGAFQSPWEFGSYSESVYDEHERRRTTSVDAKISKALHSRPVSVPSNDEEEEDNGSVDNDDSEDVEEDETGEQQEGEEDQEEEEEEEEEEEKEEEGEESVDESEDEAHKQGSLPSENKFSENTSAGTPDFFASAEGASFHANSFLELNLSRPLLKACEALGYHKPTPIQAACIPLALTGRDICGSALTGSGKTAAFALPVLERLLFRPKHVHAIRVLILTPARELAVQVHSMIVKLSQFTDIRCCLVVGGLSSKVQEVALRSMPDIVVATPGRIIDHLRNSQSVGLEDLAVLILDEADRLLELGFSGEIQELIRLCPKRRQTMLFSATMTEEVDRLVVLSLNKPVRLQADPSTKRPTTLTEEIVRIRRIREANQEAVLLALCFKTFTEKVIIFSGTKLEAHRLKIIFGLAGLKAAELHGNLTQVQRLDALELFRKQKVDFLIATDVAARGLDIVGVQTVISFACPRDITSYVHRVGRTARAGREGYAVTFVTDSDRSLLKAIAKRAGSKLKSRIVADQPIAEWSRFIEENEDQISLILREEREERELRKVEMEATKVENMIKHKEDIFSRPKKTWFATEKEKKLLAKASKEFASKGQSDCNVVMSAQQAEDKKLKEKRKREREKNLPRKKRRRLEATREMLENEESENLEKFGRVGLKGKTGQSIVELAYRRAKSMKAGKGLRNASKRAKIPDKNLQRKDEMAELFQNEMSERKPRNVRSHNASGRTKHKSSFKSKSRYKRRK